MSPEIKQAMSVFQSELYIDPMVKHLESQRRLYTANLGLDMGEDWYGEKGRKFRDDSLTYYVKMFLQATINRQWQMAATQVHSHIKAADDYSGMASLEPIQMQKEESVWNGEYAQMDAEYKRKLMERMREQAKARRDKARRIRNQPRKRNLSSIDPERTLPSGGGEPQPK